jgi:transcription initiation factor TFIIF subunit beta
MSRVPKVKVEHSAMSSDPNVKADPGPGTSPSALSEDDIYEDAGDLDFPRGDQEVYLMKLPKFLWENWSKIKDDEEIKLGTVRVANQTDTEPQKVLLLYYFDLESMLISST